MASKSDGTSDSSIAVRYSICAILLAINLLVVTLRAVAVSRSRTTCRVDDHLTAVALFFIVGLCAAIMTGVAFGLGQGMEGIYTVGMNDAWKAAIAIEFIYAFVGLAVKCSVLSYYLRRFGWASVVFRVSWWANLLLTILVFIASAAAPLFECNPLSQSFWHLTSITWCGAGSLPAVAVNAANAASICWLLILPLSSTWRLRIDRKQKMAVAIAFMFGGAALILAIVRIPLLDKIYRGGFDYSANIDYSAIIDTSTVLNTALLAFGEVTAGMVGACLPTMGTLLPSHFGRPRARSIRASTIPSFLDRDIEKQQTEDDDTTYLNNRPQTASSRFESRVTSPMPRHPVPSFDGVFVDRKVEMSYQSSRPSVDFPPVPMFNWDVPWPETPTTTYTPRTPRTPRSVLSVCSSKLDVVGSIRSRSRSRSRARSSRRSKPPG